MTAPGQTFWPSKHAVHRGSGYKPGTIPFYTMKAALVSAHFKPIRANANDYYKTRSKIYFNLSNQGQPGGLKAI